MNLPSKMFPAKNPTRLRPIFACLAFAGGVALAAPTGPRLQINDGGGKPVDNPLGKFMYFIPLISPDPIAVSTNAGNTQRARMLSACCQTNGALFRAVCKFEISGAGLQRNVFDHADFIRQHDKELKAGKALLCQLDAISVSGAGGGTVEVEGSLTNQRLVIREVRLRFNSPGRASPVCVTLHDIVYRQGAIRLENEMVARVNLLTFRRTDGTPKMEILLDSVKPEAAGDTLWQNGLGRLRGIMANLLIPPLTVPADGHQAMMDFGLALATAESSFTFPFASRLKGGQLTLE
jgi:hypothetical protein